MDWLSFGLGVATGVIFFAFVLWVREKRAKPDGVFRVDLYHPEKDVFTLEFIRPLEGVQNCKKLYFKVVSEPEPSREKHYL